jgi:hypothetical protein
LAECLELRRELGHVRFERDSLVDLRGERILERLKPPLRQAGIDVGARHGRYAAGRFRLDRRLRARLQPERDTETGDQPSQDEQHCLQHGVSGSQST